MSVQAWPPGTLPEGISRLIYQERQGIIKLYSFSFT